MCILFFAIKQHPNYPVIICANRDEFHQRPTKTMHWWPDENILAGKDLQAGGTWLGLSPTGSFSALTNYRQGDKLDKQKKSRGELVLNALKMQTKHCATNAESLKQQADFAKQLSTTRQQYNGYNLIYGPLDKLRCFDSVNNQSQAIDSGFHSICNGAYDDIWPKMALGQQALTSLIQQNKPLDIDALFLLMTNQQQAPASELPETGIAKTFEQLVSSIFIVSPSYGTRSTTIITLNNQGQIAVHERNYQSSGDLLQQQSFTLP